MSYYQEWAKKNKDKIKEYHKKYWQENKDKIKEREKIYKTTERYVKWKRDYRKIEYERHKDKIKARKKIKGLVHQNRLKRLPCQICGENKSEFHHPNYAKPYEVYHLCDYCHKKVHINETKLNDIKIYNYIGLLKKRGRPKLNN
uniref:Uncharacterized protein n=1 Tax=viral metagenome TaxID=1070528 RepID=A0A6M3ILG4_9ZZZZ